MNWKSICGISFIILLTLSIFYFLYNILVLKKESFSNSMCFAQKDDSSLVIKGLYKNGHGIQSPNMFESKHGNNVDPSRPLAGLEVIPTVNVKHSLVHPWIKQQNPENGLDEYFNPSTGVYETHKPESLHENCFITHS